MPERKPRLLVVAGPNGSGKTTLTRRILRHAWGDGCTYINPDNIAQDQFGDWNSPDASIKAANQADAIREKCLAERSDLAFETVLSISDKVDFIKRAKEAGYFIRLFFIATDDPSINASRIAKRFMEGGHTVPIDKIIERYYRSVSYGLDAALLADRAYFYDNTPEGENFRLEFRMVDGALAKTYADDLHEWVDDLLEELARPS